MEPRNVKQYDGTIHGKLIVDFAFKFGPGGDFYADNKDHARLRTADYAERFCRNVFGHLEHYVQVDTKAIDTVETGE